MKAPAFVPKDIEELRFEPGEHRYFLGQRELASVTTILNAVFPFEYTDQEALDRGTRVHKACEFDDLDDLDEASVYEKDWPYLEAWRAFRKQTGFIPDPEGIECQRYHPSLFYAGTIDRIGRIGPRRFVIDLKTGGKHPRYKLQVAGYANLLANPLDYHRGIVALDRDACFSFTEFPREEFPGDLAVFRSCLNIFNFKLKHKLL